MIGASSAMQREEPSAFGTQIEGTCLRSYFSCVRLQGSATVGFSGHGRILRLDSRSLRSELMGFMRCALTLIQRSTVLSTISSIVANFSTLHRGEIQCR